MRGLTLAEPFSSSTSDSNSYQSSQRITKNNYTTWKSCSFAVLFPLSTSEGDSYKSSRPINAQPERELHCIALFPIEVRQKPLVLNESWQRFSKNRDNISQRIVTKVPKIRNKSSQTIAKGYERVLAFSSALSIISVREHGRIQWRQHIQTTAWWNSTQLTSLCFDEAVLHSLHWTRHTADSLHPTVLWLYSAVLFSLNKTHSSENSCKESAFPRQSGVTGKNISGPTVFSLSCAAVVL